MNTVRGGVLSFLITGLIGALILWAVFIRPNQKAGEAAEAKGNAVVAAGEAAKAADAVPIIEKHFTDRERIERVTIQGNAGILAAAGAADRIPADVDRAARAALCMREVYADHAACQQLPDADPGDGQGADPGRPAAGG